MPLQGVAWDPKLVPTLVQELNAYFTAKPQDLAAEAFPQAEKEIIRLSEYKPQPVRIVLGVGDQYARQLSGPVELMARVLKTNTSYNSPDQSTIIPNLVYEVDNRQALVVEYKSPRCGGKHFPSIVSQAKGGFDINLQGPIPGYKSIVAKLAFYIIRHDLQYGMVFDIRSSIILYVHAVKNEPHRCVVSDVTPIDSPDTPIIATILGILRCALPKPKITEIPQVKIPTATLDPAQEDPESFGGPAPGPSLSDKQPISPAPVASWNPLNADQSLLAAVLLENAPLPSTGLAATIRPTPTNVYVPPPTPPSFYAWRFRTPRSQARIG
ncbi:hypothetical protein M407DRAFT_231344 [Tulasnella calospora MUT 4182]|uniref:Uncharacterized protein n=1 Tax=Tulasnella calospora MUT 4182 TaxID=1051891 RepID=A0A0C3QMJ2_9AGAM|nr:hypothetical protein M407DRAFT_231344 [Tulasnella calospora MUT 4182]